MLLIKISSLIFLTFETQAGIVEVKNEKENFVKLLGSFLRYFGKVHHTVNIYSEKQAFLDYELNEALKKVSKAAVTIHMNKTATCNVIVIKDLNSFRLLFHGKSKRDFIHKSFYLVVLTDENVDKIEEIFNLMWKLQISNVNVIHQVDGSKLSMSTFYPITSTSCNNTTPVRIDSISDMKNFFPNKFRNLYKCQLRAAIYENKPYVFNDCLEKNACRLYGRDYHLLEVLAESLNFTYKSQIHNEAGSVFENGTVTGAMRFLLNNDVDLVVGDYFLKQLRVKFFDASDTYSASEMVFVIPSGMKFTSLENLMKTFSTTVWILVFTYFGLGFVVILLIHRAPNDIKRFVFGDNIRSPTMNLISIIFGNSMHLLPRLNFARFLLMNFVLFCIVIRTTYIGSLYRLLNLNLKHKKVESINELIEKEFIIYTHDNNVDLFKDQLKLSRQIRYNNFTMDKEIFELIKDSSKKVAITRTLAKFLYYNQINFYDFSFEICSERFSSTSTVLYFPKHFYLVEPINDKLGQLKSGGLIEYWQSIYVDRKKITNQKEQRKPKKLSMNHLMGLFQILLVLNSFAIILFVVELIKS